MQNWEVEEKAKKGETSAEKVLRLLRKPTTFVIIILVCVILMVSVQLGSLKSELTQLRQKVTWQEKDEKTLHHKVEAMNSKLHHVERDEQQLKSKERVLEEKERKLEREGKNHESWGEDFPGEI